MLRVLQINLQHKKAATAAFCRTFEAGGFDVALIQEPWTSGNRVMGLGNIGGKLIHNSNSENVRSCIIVKNNINAIKMTNFCHRDIAAIRLEYREAGNTKELIITSVYLPYDSPNPPPSAELERLVEYCGLNNLQILIGADANAHHTAWNSSDINQRGEYLLDFIISNNLEILNRGTKPTFQTRNRQERIDVSLASFGISSQICNWRVDDEPSLSDHKYIQMEIKRIDKPERVYRNPRNTNWEKYRQDLSLNLTNIKTVTKTITDIEEVCLQLQEAIQTSYHENCAETRQTTSKQKWWNANLEKLRKNTRKLFNKAKKTGNWEAYQQTLTEYNKEIRKAKIESWKKFCSEVENTSDSARIQKILAKGPTEPTGTIEKPDGNFTRNGEETLGLLLQTHFPDSSEVTHDSSSPSSCSAFRYGAKKENWELAKKVVTFDGIKWAIGSFDSFKSPGPDGIIPALLQEAVDLIAPHLCRLCRASLATGYIPGPWREVKAVFIPKPGRDPSQARSYRPISLSSFMLKVTEKLVEKHIRETSLKQRPLHLNQHAFQPGKSCESALHQLVTRVENSLENKEIALVAFLDIEGAFDHTSFNSIVRAAGQHMIDDTICRWIKSMLKHRTINSTIAETSKKVTATKGCPQGGVLSPLLWNLVVDELLRNLNERGYLTLGYADDIVVIIRGGFTRTVSNLMQDALEIIEEWCTREQLRVNPSKTKLIPFTRRRNLEDLLPPSLFQTTLEFGREAKFLGVILDTKLTWNQHIQKITTKSKMTLMSLKRAIGKSWGLKPSVVHWIYTTVVRPMITYGALVWWPKTNQRQANLELAKIQRLACLCITGAQKSTPTASMETILNLPPIDLIVKAEARIGAYRLQLNGNWKPKPNGHAAITKMISNPTLTMGSDYMMPKKSLEKPFDIEIIPVGNTGVTPKQEIVWYTDGSKTETGTGAGIYGQTPRCNISQPLGEYTTVFQAEIYAIDCCLRENLRRGYTGKNILICSDSQASIKALNSWVIKSKLVWECLENLKNLSVSNKVTLKWVPGHKGIEGNEKADALAREGSATSFTGPEPATGTTKSSVRTKINQWVYRQHQTHWQTLPKLRHSKLMVQQPSRKLTVEILQLNRNQIRLITGLITGHCSLRKHLHTMGILQEEPRCRLCDEAEETATHIIFECEALRWWRYRQIGPEDPFSKLTKNHTVKRLLNLIKVTKLFTD